MCLLLTCTWSGTQNRNVTDAHTWRKYGTGWTDTPTAVPLKNFRNSSWLSLTFSSKYRCYPKLKATVLHPTQHNQLHLLLHHWGQDIPCSRNGCEFGRFAHKDLSRNTPLSRLFLDIKIWCTFEDSTLNEISPTKYLSTILLYFFPSPTYP